MKSWLPDGGGLSPAFKTLESRRNALDLYLGAFNGKTSELADQLANGAISLNDWQAAMREEIKNLHINALVLSRGGNYQSITFSEWGRLGAYLKQQYEYLHGYGLAVQAKDQDALAGVGKPYSPNYLKWRSGLYGGAAKASFYRGVAMGLLDQVPGDGKTQCKTNCKCELVFKEGKKQGEVLVYWKTNPAEHCPDCLRLEKEWNPKVIYLPVGLSAAEFVQYAQRLNLSHAIVLGGPGSGNHGHAGRPGRRGGSLPRGASAVTASEVRENILKEAPVDFEQKYSQSLWRVRDAELDLSVAQDFGDPEKIQKAESKLEEAKQALSQFEDDRMKFVLKHLGVEELSTTTASIDHNISQEVRGKTISQGVYVFNHLVSGQSGIIEFKDGGGYGRRAVCGEDGTIYVPKGSGVHAVVHELGHWLERRSQVIKDQVAVFYQRRTEGEKAIPLSKPKKHYPSNEITKPDNFINPYMGKVYENGSTEILSMGLEYMLTNPWKLAKDDPDYFDFVYNVLRGVTV